MNTSRLISLSRLVQSAGLLAGLMAASVSAYAGGGVYWAVNVDAPVQGMGRVSTAVSNTPRGVYGQTPVIYAPAPVVYAPAPVVYAPRQVVYSPPVVVQPRAVYAPVPVAYYPAPRRCEPRGGWGWHERHHHDRDDRYAWNDGGRDDERGYVIAPRGGDQDGRNWRRGH
ncbi:hypothetical protein [Aquabacterium sp.]|uniref:hypothetical protein n=1 Tax=Aquabacterium sp. TaxID=1872578 RepID=UPI0025BC9530|nr:hypothetical protein [Aquabacterium sp.]